MSNTAQASAPSPAPDQQQRDAALDTSRSILVQAPAGSGKTSLLTMRFLRLLAEVDDPAEIVAITFTKAAAAEMRHRILSEIQNAETNTTVENTLAAQQTRDAANQALARSQERNWNLLKLSSQLRIDTIDAFCREIASTQPVLSGLGGGLDIALQPEQLYRRAAYETLLAMNGPDAELRAAIEALLEWRDNNWRDLEEQLVEMLGKRDRWMQDFVLGGETDWDQLRSQLERPLKRAEAAYTEDEWRIVRSCFALLKRAAAQLRVVFAEAGQVDYAEVAQVALSALMHDESGPSDTALAIADGIRHLLVDEFQDTSRRQHKLIASLVAAWPDAAGRTVFVVGDPMQSIYFFREADAELFPRVRKTGLDLPNSEAHDFEFVQLRANFRTAPELVTELNAFFKDAFAEDDSSGISFAKAEPARPNQQWDSPRLHIHFGFAKKTGGAEAKASAHEAQVNEIVALVQGHAERITAASAAKKKFRIAVLGRKKAALVPIASALREAKIPFRAVELEELSSRPEVMDAVALAKALLNGEDRGAWLSVLRAPWCALSLSDLHKLTSGDDDAIKRSPIPELMRRRTNLLSAEGQRAVKRVLCAIEDAPQMEPAALGTRIEQLWLRLGGADCVNDEAQANLDLLWSCLDALPDGEPDLLGSALESALKKLTALPDPHAESDCGVQLMTIHKSKGLEFEVVVVPDLQGKPAMTHQKMLSWMERGVAERSETSEVTEFLVAPQQARGSERGSAKEWVDGEYRAKEMQETRRLLYVAATRAREELHLFARLDYDSQKDAELKPAAGSLLATAWPALKNEAESQLAAWKQADPPAPGKAKPGSAQEMEIRSSQTAKPAILHRLPADYEPASTALSASRATIPVEGSYERHEGGLLSRATGTAVHALLEELARLRVEQDWRASRAALPAVLPRIAAQIRSVGVDLAQAEKIANEALQLALRAAEDDDAQWILAPHPDAASESRWTGVLDGRLRTVQTDRIFRAGAHPHTEDGSKGGNVWWIIDYKTAHVAVHPDETSDESLKKLRTLFEPQLALYAKMLRLLHGADTPICAGLYYPRMQKFDWWKA